MSLRGYFGEINYSTVVKGLPHSRQRGLSRDVINPHDGHILRDRTPLSCSFGFRAHRSSRTVKSTINRPKVISVAYMDALLLGEFRDCRAKVPRSDGRARRAR